MGVFFFGPPGILYQLDKNNAKRVNKEKNRKKLEKN